MPRMAAGQDSDPSRSMPAALRFGVLAALTLGVLAIALALPPIPQDPAYHAFADTRGWLGVPNFGDVASNLAYLAAGLAGLGFLATPAGRARFALAAARLPWLVFFAGAVLVAGGSAWYHLAPANETLVWDRLAMSVAFMALFAGVVADRIDARAGGLLVLPVMLALGIASVLWWHVTERAGAGDLRFYFLLNPVGPALLLVSILALWPGRVTSVRGLAVVLLCYAAAVACEQADAAAFAVTGGAVSGHTIKHLLSAGAVLAVADMLRRVPAVT
jgi:hypothetical protein